MISLDFDTPARARDAIAVVLSLAGGVVLFGGVLSLTLLPDLWATSTWCDGPKNCGREWAGVLMAGLGGLATLLAARIAFGPASRQSRMQALQILGPEAGSMDNLKNVLTEFEAVTDFASWRTQTGGMGRISESLLREIIETISRSSAELQSAYPLILYDVEIRRRCRYLVRATRSVISLIEPLEKPRSDGVERDVTLPPFAHVHTQIAGLNKVMRDTLLIVEGRAETLDEEISINAQHARRVPSRMRASARHLTVSSVE